MNLADARDRDTAETVPCPPPPHGCGRPAGTSCRNLVTGDLLGHIPAHAARLRAAGVIHAPVDSRDLAARGERTRR